MAQLGELCLWAAIPLASLCAVASIVAVWTGRRDLAVVGARAAHATAATVMLAALGLAYALVTVQLNYIYVASFSGFHVHPGLRLAALWSGPAGGGLVMTMLIAIVASVSYQVEHTRSVAARTGTLAALVVVALFMIAARAQPFAQSELIASAGNGLPLAMRNVAWQFELLSSYTAMVGAAFLFAGAIGEQMVQSTRTAPTAEVAARIVAGSTTLALFLSLWRAYAVTGQLVDVTGAAYAVGHVPIWLLSIAYLHAPGGSLVPTWALRWRRIVGVAVFPAALGAAASLLAAGGATPPILPWSAGFGVGIVSGAMSGMTRSGLGFDRLRSVPGFGLHALTGGLISLVLAGVVAVKWLLIGPSSESGSWPFVSAAVITLLAIAVWSVSRPAGGWRAVWAVAIGSSLAFGGALMVVSGSRGREFGLIAAISAAVVVGVLADLTRVLAARSLARGAEGEGRSRRVRLLKARSQRRGASALGHLGFALVALGMGANSLSTWNIENLSPGDTLSVAARRGSGAQVTYLGLSQYKVEDLDKRVASFILRTERAAPRLMTAELTYDWISQRQFRAPGIARGLLRDHVVDLMGRGDGEEIVGRLAVRPLSSLVWLGGGLLCLSLFWPRRTAPYDRGVRPEGV